MPGKTGRTIALAVLALLPSLAAAGDNENRQLFALLRGNAMPQVQADAVRKHFTSTQLTSGSAIANYGGDFAWAIESTQTPTLVIDDQPAPAMRSLPGNLWVHTQQVSTGRSHAWFYRAGDKQLGNRFDKAAYTVDSYPQPGVAQGKLSEQLVVTSQVYRGHKMSYWIYASPGVDPAAPSPLMVFHDGQGFITATGSSRLTTVVENLVQQKKIPPMVFVLIAPGYVGDDASAFRTPPMRTVLYDTVNDDYNKMIASEVLPEVEKRYKLRADGYSRGAAGQSSGGICAFNMAWWRPDSFSRVLSRIGSFTALQWHGQAKSRRVEGHGEPGDGGYIFPFLVRQQERKNIRVWLDDGSNDLENDAGSWPLQNIQLANSLKRKEYDFYFSFGNQQHSTEHGNAELPRALAWLWRGYDPAKTSETYVMDPAEKAKPEFRVAIVNR